MEHEDSEGAEEVKVHKGEEEDEGIRVCDETSRIMLLTEPGASELLACQGINLHPVKNRSPLQRAAFLAEQWESWLVANLMHYQVRSALHLEPSSENVRLEEPFLAVVRGHLHSTIARAFGEDHKLKCLSVFGRFILAYDSWRDLLLAGLRQVLKPGSRFMRSCRRMKHSAC